MIHEIDNWRTYDDNGVMMPWYTRPCLEWLDKLPLNEMSVFEYGCGASSLWYISRRSDYYGVDGNEEWLFAHYNCHYNSQYFKWDKQDYLECIGEYQSGPFDIIIIDGDYRDDCTEYALKHLKPGGYLICDNFEQASADFAHWPKTRELTKNLKVVGMFKEPTHDDWVSAVWQNLPA